MLYQSIRATRYINPCINANVGDVRAIVNNDFILDIFNGLKMDTFGGMGFKIVSRNPPEKKKGWCAGGAV